jgi:hypothetical protein
MAAIPLFFPQLMTSLVHASRNALAALLVVVVVVACAPRGV